MANELIAPISEDLRKEDNRMDITKGIEHINYKDELCSPTLPLTMGDWASVGSSGVSAPATGTAQANVYPVVVGNDQYDSQATGKVTVILSGGFIYRTNKYVAGSYTDGQNLCVKDLGGGEKVPSAAGSGDAIVARVYKMPDSKGIMEILVLNR